MVLTESDYKVSVGGVECVVMSVTSSQLTCLPSEQSTTLPSASVVVNTVMDTFAFNDCIK